MGDLLPVSDAVLTRRIKNRERQRRYRARKRLEANNGNAVQLMNQPSAAHFINQPPPPVAALSLVEVSPMPNDGARLYCPRDWKKDAREVKKVTIKATGSSGCANGHSLSLTLVPDDPVTHNGGRDWKADARNRKAPIFIDLERSPGNRKAPIFIDLEKSPRE